MEKLENDDYEDIDHAHEEGSDPAQAKNTCEIYSYFIAGSEAMKPIQLIASWVSEKFTNIMTDMDTEQLWISMNESQTMWI